MGGSRTAGVRSGRIGSRGATGGSVRTRPGTRSGRTGRSYRIRGHGRYGHGRYGYGYGYGYGHRYGGYYGHGFGYGLGGYYYAWHPYYYPYYDIYPYYGLYFGYGLSYYGPRYASVFVDATDYYPTEVIVRREIVERAPASAPGQVEDAPAGDGGFPEPAPQGGEPGAGEGAGEGAGDGNARKPHPDFEPAVKDFLDGRYQKALERLDRIVSAEPDNGEAWLAAMHANFALGRYGRAGSALAKAAALDAFPRGYRFDPRPLYGKTGNFDRAVKALDSHVAKNPKDADAVLVRAYLHVALGERKQAQDLIQTVLQVRPADETAPALALALLPPPPPPKPAR